MSYFDLNKSDKLRKMLENSHKRHALEIPGKPYPAMKLAMNPIDAMI